MKNKINRTLNEISKQERDGIHQIIIENLINIKDEIQQSFNSKNYSMEDFLEDNVDCLHALMYLTKRVS